MVLGFSNELSKASTLSIRILCDIEREIIQKNGRAFRNPFLYGNSNYTCSMREIAALAWLARNDNILLPPVIARALVPVAISGGRKLQ